MTDNKRQTNSIKKQQSGQQTAYLAGGCFWCITPPLKELEGVTAVVSGYSGGSEQNPSYEDVKQQKTGHRETVRVEYDGSVLSFERLLQVFLQNVDVYDGEGQFIDRGRSYTLAVYYTDEEQHFIARTLLGAYDPPARVALEPFRAFYPAEECHQDYYLKNPEAFAEEMKTSRRVR